MRKWLAIGLNILAPGTGLILLRREWLGTLLAAFFSLLCLVGLWGLLIVPMELPRWLVVSSLIAAGLVWTAAQVLLMRRMRVACTPEMQTELEQLCLRADELLEAGDVETAFRTLQFARSLNDEDVEINIRWAHVLTAMGQFGQARRAWKLVCRLDRRGEAHRMAVEALERLPA
jgi:hypothetical protein